MTDPGWPLIPREVLPAPVPAAHRRSRPKIITGAEVGTQLPMFGAESTEPSPADLAGLLAGPGRLGRMGGTARVSVRVDAAWRVHVLVGELVRRGLVVTWHPLQDQPPEVRPTADQAADGPAASEDPGAPAHPDAASVVIGASPEPTGDAESPRAAAFEVRTAYSSRLNGLARAWPPAGDRLFLGGARLRLWVAAAGEPRPGGYALGLGPDGGWDLADAALVRAGLAGVVVRPGPFYLISGRKRLRRLAELVGERPAAAPGAVWPDGAGA